MLHIDLRRDKPTKATANKTDYRMDRLINCLCTAVVDSKHKMKAMTCNTFGPSSRRWEIDKFVIFAVLRTKPHFFGMYFQ